MEGPRTPIPGEACWSTSTSTTLPREAGVGDEHGVSHPQRRRKRERRKRREKEEGGRRREEERVAIC